MKITIGMRGVDDLEEEMKFLLRTYRDRRKPMAEVKMIMLQDVDRHFQREEGPDGKWAPLKVYEIKGNKVVSYRLKHGEASKAKILQKTGRLRASQTGVSGNDGAEVGTNVVYGKQHQNGDPSKNLPQRVFLWLSDEAQVRILDRLNYYFWRQ